MTDLLRKKEHPFKWTPEAADAFSLLKQKVAERTQLVCMDESSDLYIASDFSRVGWGFESQRKSALTPTKYISSQVYGLPSSLVP